MKWVDTSVFFCTSVQSLQPPDGDGGQPPDDSDDPAGLVTYLPIPFSILPLGRPLGGRRRRAKRDLIGTRQGVTKRCRLSLLTNSALVYESQCGGDGGGGVAGSQPMSIAVHITWLGAQINFGDLPPYLTYGTWKCCINVTFKILLQICWKVHSQNNCALRKCSKIFKNHAVLWIVFDSIELLRKNNFLCSIFAWTFSYWKVNLPWPCGAESALNRIER